MRVSLEKNETGYSVVSDIIERWCDKHYWDDFLVTIKYWYDVEKKPTINTEILEYDGYRGFEWVNDWWEGQQNVELLGFMPVSELKFENIDEMVD